MERWTTDEDRPFAPCPVCRQYSHSIDNDKLAAALMHFESMYAHPLRGTPMGHNFDERTRDCAQVLIAAARAHQSANRPRVIIPAPKSEPPLESSTLFE